MVEKKALSFTVGIIHNSRLQTVYSCPKSVSVYYFTPSYLADIDSRYQMFRQFFVLQLLFL